MGTKHAVRNLTLYWIAWIVTILLYLIWPATHLTNYGWDNDEGLYLQRAALVNAGHPLYVETLFNKPPLLIWILQLAFRMMGTHLETARLAVLLMAVPGIASLGATARLLWGRWAGVIAALALLAVPEVSARLHVAMSDLPAMWFTLLALAAALRFRSNRQLKWAAAAGVLMGAGLLVHPLLAYMGLPLGLTLLTPGSHGQDRNCSSHLKPLLLFGASAALVFMAVTVMFGKPLMDAVFRHNLTTSSLDMPVPLTQPQGAQLTAYIGNHHAFVLLAVASGLIILLNWPARRKGMSGAIVLIWLGATVTTLLKWWPVWSHYCLFLMFPLATIIGAGLRAALEPRPTQAMPPKWLRYSRGFVTLLALICVAYVFQQRAKTGVPLRFQWTPERLAARRFIEATTAPGDYVASDDAFLVFAAGRLVPPPFTEVSFKSIESGFLTTGDAIRSMLQQGSELVLFATGRLKRLPNFQQWIRMIAAEEHSFGSIRAYRLFTRAPSQPPKARLGQEIHLIGYHVSSEVASPGDTITATLLWQATAHINTDYHVFVHLMDANHALKAQHDGPPILGTLPTTSWPPGPVVPDPHLLHIPVDAAPGTYTIGVGMYQWPGLERVSAFQPDGTRWPDDWILLTDVLLSAPP